MATGKKIIQMSDHDKLRILEYVKGGMSDKSTVSRFMKNYDETQSIARKPGSGRKKLVDSKVLHIIASEIAENDGVTAKDLAEKLNREHCIKLSRMSVMRARKQLGYVYRGSHYCQLIRPMNVEKRLNWAKKVARNIKCHKEKFDNVIFSDETKIEAGVRRSKSLRRLGFAPKYKGKHKHPSSVMVWGGISRRGRTKLIIFTGIMDQTFYVDQILKNALVPSAEKLYPGEQFRFMQDNDPKHTSQSAVQFMLENQIDWWKTPAESPDLNPIGANFGVRLGTTNIYSA